MAHYYLYNFSSLEWFRIWSMDMNYANSCWCMYASYLISISFFNSSYRKFHELDPQFMTDSITFLQDDCEVLSSLTHIVRDYHSNPPPMWYIVSCEVCATTCDFAALALVDGDSAVDENLTNQDKQLQETQATAYCPLCCMAWKPQEWKEKGKLKKKKEYWLKIIYMKV